MESLSLEEKIATFKKKIEELDELAAPASGGPNADPSVAPEVEKEFKKELEKGKIAAMRNRLVRKGLSVNGGDPDAAADEADELEIPPDASEAEKAARLAAEFEMGKIAAMKDRLASKGLDLDAATVAAKALKAVEAAGNGTKESTALGIKQPYHGGGADESKEPSMPQAGEDDEVGGRMAVEPMQQTAGESTLVPTAASDLGNATAESVEAQGESSADVPPGTSDELNPTDEVENNISAEALDINPEDGSLGRKGESAPVVPAGVSDDINPAAEPVDQGESPPVIPAEASDVGKMTGGSKEQDADAPPVFPVVSSTSDTGSAMVESTSVAPPAEASEYAEDARPQISSADDPGQPAVATAGGKGEGEVPSSKVASHVPPTTLVPDDADAAPVPTPPSTQNGKASPAVVPAASELTSIAAPTADQKGDEDTAKRATEPSASMEGSNEEPSKAKAARAAVKARASPATQGSTQLQQRQYRRQSHVAESTGSASNGARPEARRAAAAGAGTKTKQSRRQSFPSRAFAGRRESEHNGAKGFVAPPDGSSSCATSSAPVTPGLDVSPFAASAGPAVQRRRSSTPVRKRASPRSQRQVAANPARPAEETSPAAAMTPVVAEELDIHLHEQARQSRERLEQHRKEGATPSFFGTRSSNVSPVVMTPTSAERSGNRLHEQAREARERLERRRREVVTSPLSPFTPRLWSNPRMGNPSVAGVERVESLYRDAILRNSKLEMARRAAERPSECTFTPEISKRAASRGRTEKRGGDEGDDIGAREGGKISTFDALYLDAKRRRAKMDALWGAHMKKAMVRASPVITARGRQASVVPLEVRMKENAKRWVRRWKELEKRKLQLEQQGCTFMPNLYVGRSVSAPRIRPRRETIAGGSGDQDGIASFFERSYRFQMERGKKMEKLKQEAMERERAEATFRPKLLSSREGDDAGLAVTDVFERLLKAATEQEMNKAALKEQLWRQERERYHDFQPQLPSRGLEGPSVPLELRMQKSTEDWIKSRAQREQSRRELEAEQCTFRPSLGGGAGAGTRRSASLEPRLRARSPLTSSSERNGDRAAAAAGAFAVRSAALQEAREQRLEKLRKEKMKLKLKEATFQSVTGKNARGDGGGGGGALSSTVETGRLGTAEEEKQRVVDIPVSRPGAAPAAAASRSTAAAVAPKKSAKRGVDMEELSARLQELAAAEGSKDAKDAIEDDNAEGEPAAAAAAVPALPDASDADTDVKEIPSSEQQLEERDAVALAPDAGQTTDEREQKEEEYGERGAEKVGVDKEKKQEAGRDEEEEEGPEFEAKVAVEEAAVAAVDPVVPVSGGNAAAVTSNGHEDDEKMSAGAVGAQGVEEVGGAGDKEEEEDVEGEGEGPNEEEGTGNEGQQHQTAGVDAEESLKAAALSSGADDSAAEEEFAFEQLDPSQPAAQEEEAEKETEERGQENYEGSPENGVDLQRQPLQVDEEEKEAWIEEEVGVGYEDEEERWVEGQEEGDEEEDEGHNADEDIGDEDTVEEEEDEDENDMEENGGMEYAGHDMEEDMKEEEGDDNEDDYYDDDDDDEEFSYINASYAGREPTNQVSRSLEDFERAQREIAAKLRAL